MFINQKIALTALGLCCICICQASSALLEGIQIPDSSEQSIALDKEKALDYARKGDAKRAVEYAKLYVKATADLTIINDHLFQEIKTSTEYLNFKKKFIPKFGFSNIIYFIAGCFGLFIGFFISLKKKSDRISVFLICMFVVFNSLFIIHLSLHLSQLQYKFPHTLFSSATFSFLYGPLIYHYIKRTTYNYSFKWTDLVHLIPSLVLLIYMIPYYSLSGLEKFNLLFERDKHLLPGLYIIVTIKVLSLVSYFYFSLHLYKSKKKQNNRLNKNVLIWQRNILFIFGLYVISYIIYGAALAKLINLSPLPHFQVLIMILLIFYIAYVAHVQPEVFSGKIQLNDPKNLFKYRKSGLTPSYSIELKERLLVLLNEEKVYKRNDICLDWIANKLDTNRHSASQVINEHFNMNFFELINNFRIQEAIELLKNNIHHNLNIIDIAYEVGFNNKVTFNKSFKKVTQCTPSKYVESQMVPLKRKA